MISTRTARLLAIAFTIAACKGTEGPRGQAGPQGQPGQTGATGDQGNAGASLALATLDPGSVCAYGGVSIASGTVSASVCNGAPGLPGTGLPGTSVTALALAPGVDPACPAGGSKFITGATVTYACNAAGASACPAGQALCSGACRRIDIDPANCGACGNVCASGSCVDGLCSKLVFVTSQAWTGDLGGISGADSRCQTLAAAAGLNGTFKAWLSDDLGNSPNTRFTRSPAAYVLVNGAVVAKNWSALVGALYGNASTNLTHSISLDERGAQPAAGSLVWTGTMESGTGATGLRTCNNWTSGTNTDTGYFGSWSNFDIGWTSSSTSYYTSYQCSTLGALYCFEQ
jgi:hypothetical protein